MATSTTGVGAAAPATAASAAKSVSDRTTIAQNFDAFDGRPADLVFMLLSPADKGADHLKALARVSRFLRRAEMRDKLRAALERAGYTAEVLTELLGAGRPFARDPAEIPYQRRLLPPGSPLETVAELFMFGRPVSEERLAVFAATLMIVGIQIFFSSFLLSILGLRRQA